MAGRYGFFILVSAVLVVSSSAVARLIPGVAEAAPNDAAEASYAEVPPADPVVLEPIRPLLSSEDSIGAPLSRPEPCGAVSPLILGLSFVSLGFMGRSSRRFHL